MNNPYIRIKNLCLRLPLEISESRLFSYRNIKVAVKSLKEKKETAKVGANFINIQGKQYVNCLNNINLTINQKDRLGIIGHNGSGKSTLLRIIAGIYPSSSGSIEVKGDIACFISQGIGVNPEMNAFDFLKMDTALKGYSVEISNEIAEKVIDFIELGDFAYAPLRTYSSGMQARLFSTLAIFSPAEILLIDEGIGAGDRAFYSKFNSKLDEFISKSNLMVIASHNRQLIRKWCNKAIVLEKGSIIFEGNVDECYEFYEK
ncbi:ATP-binding cassette domain-containing protein [Alphaproteobacteria bacterium]|nr:ATP-binding cassette domain-containing protein [Alphaproteobacteria bacterium]